jgi:DNA-binding MarR family transcriptional regulator
MPQCKKIPAGALAGGKPGYYNHAMQNAPVPPPIGFLLKDASRLLRRRFEREIQGMPMTPAQLQVIAQLSRHEGIGQAGLAALLDIEPMTLSRHVDRMEAAGLVERRQDPNDRRARQLFTTQLSRDLLAPMRARADEVYGQALTGVSPDARAGFVAVLEAIIRNLTAAESGAGYEDAGRRSEKEVA